MTNEFNTTAFDRRTVRTDDRHITLAAIYIRTYAVQGEASWGSDESVRSTYFGDFFHV